MRLTDLELLRWKLFHEEHIKQPYIVERKLQTTRIDYWKELGAFVSTLPRQSGKTTMLLEIANRFIKDDEAYFVLVLTITMKKIVMQNLGFDERRIAAVSEFRGINPRGCNLLVDEYNLIKPEHLDNILDYDWKTVTMVGTLR